MKKIKKIFYFILIKVSYYLSMELSTNIQFHFYKKHGMKFKGKPRYISAKTHFDGTDYSLISIGEGVTISSNIRVLTHDWAIDTVHMAFAKCDPAKRPIGQLREISFGDYSFIGTNSVIMPGCKIGKGVIVGAGSVVRGEIPDYSIIIGNPAKVIGDSREYCRKVFKKINCNYEEF